MSFISVQLKMALCEPYFFNRQHVVSRTSSNYSVFDAARVCLVVLNDLKPVMVWCSGSYPPYHSDPVFVVG
jgi:hypothetical protein